MSKRSTAAARRGGKIRVFVVDDHPIVRHGITLLINQQKDLTVCGEAADSQTALTRIMETKPDVAVIDLTLRRANGLELIKNLRAVLPELPILVLSIHDEALYAERAVRAGAKGYLMKQEATDKVLDAIRTVLRGELFLSEKARQKMAAALKKNKSTRSLPLEDLTDRELEVLWLLGKGNDTHQIAKELHLTTSTVETHREHIKKKLELRTATALVHYATRWVETEGAG